MDAETWMNANKALELGFCDEIMYKDAASPGVAVEDSFSFSRRAVTNSLMDKVKARIPKPPEGVPVESLEKRLFLLSH